MNTKQKDNESERAYIERIDRLILEDYPLSDEAMLLGVVFGLKKGTKLWRCMTTEYPASYADF